MLMSFSDSVITYHLSIFLMKIFFLIFAIFNKNYSYWYYYWFLLIIKCILEFTDFSCTSTHSTGAGGNDGGNTTPVGSSGWTGSRCCWVVIADEVVIAADEVVGLAVELSAKICSFCLSPRKNPSIGTGNSLLSNAPGGSGNSGAVGTFGLTAKVEAVKNRKC
jgi:hypothetical protein